MSPDDPLYLKTTREKREWWLTHADYAAATFPLYGEVPSLPYGIHVGWVVDGKRYPRSAFREHQFDGSFTGCGPVGLTPLIPLS